MDAGIAMRWPLVAVTCAVRANEEATLDPTVQEEKVSFQKKIYCNFTNFRCVKISVASVWFSLLTLNLWMWS